MATSEERIKILKMIEEGKLSATEAAELLEALEERAPAKSAAPPLPPLPPIRDARWFRVVVTDLASGKTRVNVRLPINVINAGMKMGAKFSTQVEGLDAARLIEALRNGERGRIFETIHEEDGERVEVIIE